MKKRIIPCSTSTADCAGVLGGSAYTDACGNCVGGTTGQQPCSSIKDCAGVIGGSAYIDVCGKCVEGTTGIQACNSTIDCAGVRGGTAYSDDCGNCVDGTKVKEPCLADERICDATAFYYAGSYNCSGTERPNPSDPQSSNIKDQGKNNMSNDTKIFFKSSNLYPSVQDSLNKMLKKVLEDCFNKALGNIIANEKDLATGKNAYKKANTIMIDDNLAGRAQAAYNNADNNISVVSKYMITNIDESNVAAVTEELYHLYQYQYYTKSGDLTYTMSADKTIRKSSWSESSGYLEFEPKFVQDLSAIMRGDSANGYHDWSQLRNPDEIFKDKYFDWLKSLTKNGTAWPESIDFTIYDIFAREWQKQSMYSFAKFDTPIRPKAFMDIIKKSDCIK